MVRLYTSKSAEAQPKLLSIIYAIAVYLRLKAAAEASVLAVIFFVSVKFTYAYIGIGTVPGVYVVVISVVINRVMRLII